MIEVIVDIGIVAVIAAAIVSAYSASFKAMDLAKAKMGAVALANEKMEEIRNMPYDSLATMHGLIYPPGNLSDDQVIMRKGIQYKVHTVISYVDDSYDGNIDGTVPGKPKDLYPYDYKKAEITVTKVGRNGPLAVLSSNVAAKAAETPTNSGIIRICVVDEIGAPVPDAVITISNSAVDPAVDISATTASDGCIMVPSLPPDHQNGYHLTATKGGYSTDMTYPRTPQNPNALLPDVDVLVQQVTNQTLIIDRFANMKIDIVDNSGQPVAGAVVHIEGKKEKYFNPRTPKYTADLTADASGHIELPNIEFDDYTISVSGWIVAATSPYQPIGLRAGETLPVKIIVTTDGGLPRISSVEPLTGKTGETVSITIKGANFAAPTVKLIDAGGGEIVGTNIAVTGNNIIDADFNLAGAAAGLRDIVIETAGGVIRQSNGFTIVN